MATENKRIITYPDYIREYHEVCKRGLSSTIRLKEYLESKDDIDSKKGLENILASISKFTKRIELLAALEATF